MLIYLCTNVLSSSNVSVSDNYMPIYLSFQKPHTGYKHINITAIYIYFLTVTRLKYMFTQIKLLCLCIRPFFQLLMHYIIFMCIRMESILLKSLFITMNNDFNNAKDFIELRKCIQDHENILGF